jgi:DNA polymerase III delta prime subunit
MFENIIGQQETIGVLRGELAHGEFPRASLFFGPAYAGKLSTALEVARVLTCQEGHAAWSCECRSCSLQKELSHPHTVLIGSRYFEVEIAASAGALLRGRRAVTQFLFLRAVRKLTRRFDAAVVDPDDAKMKGAPEKVSRVEELLAEIEPGKELPEERALGELLEKIVAGCVQLCGHLRGEGVAVGQVRRLAAWAHVTASGSRKVAIIENADRMQDSARNALLKLLEEPPAAVSLILLSARRAAVIPTIISRLRPYSFGQRSAQEEREVMEKIFREETPSAESLRGFFLAWKEINPEKLSALSRKYLELAAARETGGVDILAELAELFPDRRAREPNARSPAQLSPKEAISSFLEELTFRFQELLRAGGTPVETLEEWTAAVKDALARIETYNMSPQTAVESLFYRMRAVARRGDSS